MNKPLHQYYRPEPRVKIINDNKVFNAFVIIGSIIGVGIICLFSSCNTLPVPAAELKASWYSVASLKRDGQWNITKGRMANGEFFNDDAMVGATWICPLNTLLRITSVSNGKSVVVKVKDRISRRFARTRIDLSKRAFFVLSEGHLEKGLIPVRVEVIK